MAAETGPAAPKRAIVLSGGGARGAYEAGVLRFILEDLPRRTGVVPRMDIVSGTSVGAIHACFLAATADLGEERGRMIVKIWEDLHIEEVFRFSTRDLISLPRKLMGTRKMAELLKAGQRPDRLYGLLDTAPLEHLVLHAIPWRDIRRNLRAGNVESVCVTATQIATGRAVVFVERKDRDLPPWASQENIRMQGIRLLPIHALASAAIPLLFPAVRVGARYYADGGLRLNTPLAPAVRLGANKVLVIGLSHGPGHDTSEALAQQRTEGFGNPMFLFGKVLNALLLSPIDTDLARMQFINEIIDSGERVYGEDFLARMNQEGVEKNGRPLQRIDHLAIRPSVDLGLIAGELMQGRRGSFEPSRGMRIFLRAFGRGADPKEADLLSYLLFDTHYAQPLTELGYSDAASKEAELAAFFRDEKP